MQEEKSDIQKLREAEINDSTEVVFAHKGRHGSALGIGVVIIILCALLFVAIWSFIGVSGEQSQEQSAHSIRQTIMETSMQCFAIEGSYPPSLKYLERNYGLSINTDDFVVTYEAFASNVMPSVTVKPK